jgi:DNA invertase Pin-like site-specific DNA recombinase
MRIGYARVSTDDQNLSPQVDALKAAGCDLIHQDLGVSGATSKRDGLDKALADLGDGDTLVVWKLDRLGRSLSFLIAMLDDFKRRSVGFQSLTDGIDTGTAGGKLVFHIMGALAEFERALIQERTRAGLDAAKRRGVKLGRPRKLPTFKIDKARKQIEAGEESIPSMARLLDVSAETLRRALKA